MPEPKDYNYIRKFFRYNGTRYSVYGKTEEEALNKKAEMLAQLKRAEKTSGENMTVNAWYEQWKDLYKEPSGMTAKSLLSYDEKYQKYVKPAIGRMKLKDVKDYHLQKILNSEAGRSYSHLTKLRSTMQQLFSRARKSRLIVYDPSEDLTLPAYTKGSRRSLTEQEREVFLAVEPTVPGGIMLYTMLCTGMRPGELMALQWRDVDFAANTISVSKSLESGSWNTIKSTKTEAGVRIIPMRAELRERLLPLRGEPLRPVFTNQAGNMHSTTTFQRLWSSTKRAMDIYLGAELYRNKIVSSKLADDLVPYCLRHTFCTDLQRAGVPINVAKDLMGHSDISVTANIYTHRDEHLLQASITKLDELLGINAGSKKHTGTKIGTKTKTG